MDSSPPGPNQKWLGVLHGQGLWRETFIEIVQKQSKETIDWLWLKGWLAVCDSP